MNKRYRYLTPDDFVKAEKNGINKETLRSRVNKYGWDIDRAINEPARLQVNDINKWIPLALENGISERALRGRFERGWAPYVAATKPLMKRGERHLQ